MRTRGTVGCVIPSRERESRWHSAARSDAPRRGPVAKAHTRGCQWALGAAVDARAARWATRPRIATGARRPVAGVTTAWGVPIGPPPVKRRGEAHQTGPRVRLCAVSTDTAHWGGPEELHGEWLDRAAGGLSVQYRPTATHQREWCHALYCTGAVGVPPHRHAPAGVALWPAPLPLAIRLSRQRRYRDVQHGRARLKKADTDEVHVWGLFLLSVQSTKALS